MPDQQALARGRDFESHVAQISGGSLLPGSGNKWHAKGDVDLSTFLIQCKAESKRSWAQTRRELREAQSDAVGTGKPAALALLDDDDEEIFVCRLSDLIEALSSGITMTVRSNGEDRRRLADVPSILREVD